jgi:diguanylate cyclase (GGDEF)-like protein
MFKHRLNHFYQSARNVIHHSKQVTLNIICLIIKFRLELKSWVLLNSWLLLMSASLVWSLYDSYHVQKEFALKTARSFFQQLSITINWNVENHLLDPSARPQTQPSQLNPASMIRQLSEIANQENDIQFHITSLQPLGAQNTPTPWEARTLREFESGLLEKGTFISRHGRQVYRYMAPLYTRKSCLACHGDQGYQIGDIRGGITIILPNHLSIPWVSLTITHIIFLLFGSFVIIVITLLLQHKHAKLHQQAMFDTLTRIPNRRYFDDRLQEEFQRSQKHQWPLSLILCDIDYFKQYNDQLGHQAGDQCLYEVAQTIQDCLRRTNDFCARYGGEEFVIILPNSNLHHALQRAEMVRQAILDRQLLHPTNEYVTMSLGVASAFDETAVLDEVTLIKHADHALYRAKQYGRNRVESYS